MNFVDLQTNMCVYVFYRYLLVDETPVISGHAATNDCESLNHFRLKYKNSRWLRKVAYVWCIYKKKKKRKEKNNNNRPYTECFFKSTCAFLCFFSSSLLFFGRNIQKVLFSAFFGQKCAFFCWVSYFSKKTPLFWRFWAQKNYIYFKICYSILISREKKFSASLHSA